MLAHRAREKNDDCSTFSVPANNAESLQQSFMYIGQEFGILRSEDKQANAKKLVQRQLS